MSTNHAPSPSTTARRSPRGSGQDPQDGAGLPGYDDDFDDAYDDVWDDDEELLGAPPQILWGRIAFFGLALLLAFVLGRLTAGGNDEAAEAAQLRVDELTSQLEQARAEIDALEAGGAEAAEPADDAAAPAEAEDAPAGESGEGTDGAADSAAADGDESAADSAAEDEAAAPAEPEGTTYTVEAGDNLFGLAERFYDDGRQWRVISEANNLGPGAVLSTGQTLTIPPAP